MTHYDVLGVAPDADPAEIKRAYRRRARCTHPDSGGDEAEFMAVRAAWDELSDRGRRDMYDEMLASRGASTEPGPRPSTAPHTSEPAWGEERPMDTPRAAPDPAPPSPPPPPPSSSPYARPRPLPPHWVDDRHPAPPASPGWRELPWRALAMIGGVVVLLAAAVEAFALHRPGVLLGYLLLLGVPALAAWRMRRTGGRRRTWALIWLGTATAALTALHAGGVPDPDQPWWAAVLAIAARAGLALWAVAFPAWTHVAQRTQHRRTHDAAHYAAYVRHIDQRRARAEEWATFLGSREAQVHGCSWVQHRQINEATTAVLLQRPDGTYLSTWAWGVVPVHQWVVLDPHQHVLHQSVTDLARQAWNDVRSSPRPPYVPSSP